MGVLNLQQYADLTQDIELKLDEAYIAIYYLPNKI
jgi:hypothetical protein